VLKREPAFYDRAVDVLSVVLISLAAVLTALCGYQAGRWGGRSTELYNETGNYRALVVEAHDTSNELHMIDIGVFLRYIEAVHARDAELAQFLFARFRPEALRAVKAWIATRPLRNPRAPSSPFVMPQYRLRTDAEANRIGALADASFRAAQEANHHGEDFLLLTVIFAAVSFMAGISTKMVFPNHLVVVAVGSIALIYGIVRLVRFPFL
jgi:hypothetical protein